MFIQSHSRIHTFWTPPLILHFGPFYNFHWLGGPLGRVSHRVDMSDCVFVCSCPFPMFLCLSLALRSHDQFPGLCCYGLDLWISPRVGGVWLVDCPRMKPKKTGSYSRLDSWIIPAWSLKNKDLFWIGLVDRPCMEP